MSWLRLHGWLFHGRGHLLFSEQHLGRLEDPCIVCVQVCLVAAHPLTECHRPHDHVHSMYVTTYSVGASRRQNVHHEGWLHDPLSVSQLVQAPGSSCRPRATAMPGDQKSITQKNVLVSMFAACCTHPTIQRTACTSVQQRLASHVCWQLMVLLQSHSNGIKYPTRHSWWYGVCGLQAAGPAAVTQTTPSCCLKLV